MLLELREVAVGYGSETIASQVSFVLRGGEIGCLLGPSGTGKTTLLRAIAGFEPVLQGAIIGDGSLLSDPRHSVSPERRGIGLVFQDFALLPHLDTRANIGLGLFRWPKRQREERVAQLLEMVGLQAQARRYPHELSGGMQQRVALARALAPKPRLLLLDEPFSSLDPELRERLSLEIRAILKAEGTTALLVTHSQTEAYAMADQVGVLSAGRLHQWAPPYEIYHRPLRREVADFIGERIWLDGRIEAPGRVASTLGPLPTQDTRLAVGTAVQVLLRPDDIIHDDSSPTLATVLARAFRGADFLYTLQLADGTRLLSLVPSHHDHAVGQRIGIRTQLDHVVVFPR